MSVSTGKPIVAGLGQGGAAAATKQSSLTLDAWRRFKRNKAAIAGLGLALLPDFLIVEELASGALVTVLDRPLRSDGDYWLVWPPERAEHPPLAAFREWLVRETAG